MSKQDQIQNRHKLILKLVESSEEASLSRLCEATGCSETTIRNDLRTLEKQGKLLRTFGGAVRAETSVDDWLNIGLREKTQEKEKREIACYIADHILKPGMTVMLDAGTTCMVLAQEIARRRLPVTVLTHSFHAAMALSPALDCVSLYVIGGMYNPVSGSLYDTGQPEVFKHLRADVYFMGADAVDPDTGVAITGMSGLAEWTTKHAMMERSLRTYVLADHTKLFRRAMKYVCGVEGVDGIITSAGLTEKQREELSRAGIRLIIAGE